MNWNQADSDTKVTQREIARRRLVVLEYVPRNGDVVVIDRSEAARAADVSLRWRRQLLAATR